MIINHKYKFIFVKTRKTASSSMEIWLKQATGERWKANDHRSIHSVMKTELAGYFTFCFERNPFDKAISYFWWRAKHGPRQAGNAPIAKHFTSRAPNVNACLRDWPEPKGDPHLSNWHLYADGPEIAVDFVGRYENMMDDLTYIKKRLNLPMPLKLNRAKGNVRKNREHYSKVLDANSRARIEQDCAREIEHFGYQWQS